MLLHRLLENDLHRARSNVSATPLMIETPAKTTFVPAVVSTGDAGRFLIARRLTKEGRLRSAVFKQDSDRVDDLIRPMLEAAYTLSVESNFPNRFDTAAKAFDYINQTSSTGAHPHVVLVPSKWDQDNIEKFVGTKQLAKSTNVYRKFCRIILADVKFPVFFSRPDFVGMYTQFPGGYASLFLHNVRNGLAFVPPGSRNARRKIS